MKDVTVIIPVHELNSENQALLNKALLSYNKAKNENTKLMIVCPETVKDELGNVTDCKFIVTKEGESTWVSHLINLGVSNVDTEYFSVLELDDQYTENAFRSWLKYLNGGFSASVYLPLTEAVDYASQDSFGYINEAPLASSFSQELNYLDEECMMDYSTANFTGAIINKNDFVSLGTLKESMKLYFWHEFAMRALHNGKRIFVIPRVGYLHTVNRLTSFYGSLDKTMTRDESTWWLDTANKEYYFKTDRNKTYEE